MSNITIYHNPAYGTSRNTLETIRDSGIEPAIIYYLETPPTRNELVKLIADVGTTVRALPRKSVEPYKELGFVENKFTYDQLIDLMLQHPILTNRPIVVTPLGTHLCRPSEVVLEILLDAQKDAFTKEDGERVVDEAGNRLKQSGYIPPQVVRKMRLIYVGCDAGAFYPTYKVIIIR